MRSPLSERFERSAVGQVVISAGIVLVLAVMVGTHLPDSELERSVGPTSNRVIRMLGSEQAWGVFAPNPRSTSIGMYAVITFEDGSTARWEVPEGPRIGANLRYYRWRKWLERVRADSYRGIWAPTARWIAEEASGGPSPVAQVELVRRYRRNSLSGPQPPWQEAVYFTLPISQAEEGGG